MLFVMLEQLVMLAHSWCYIVRCLLLDLICRLELKLNIESRKYGMNIFVAPPYCQTDCCRLCCCDIISYFILIIPSLIVGNLKCETGNPLILNKRIWLDACSYSHYLETIRIIFLPGSFISCFPRDRYHLVVWRLAKMPDWTLNLSWEAGKGDEDQEKGEEVSDHRNQLTYGCLLTNE